VLDPFMGSGVVGCECVKMKLDYIGIERDEDMYSKADLRIKTTTAAYVGRVTLNDFI